MGNIINTLATLIKMLADLFKFPSLCPAMLFVALNQLFILPHFEFASLVHAFRERDLSDQVLTGFLLSVFLGYFINAIEVPIIKFYEGYSWKDTWLGQCLVDYQRKRRAALEEQEPNAVDDSFPCDTDVLPTRLGNTFAAFEAYPMKKYRIDSVTAWPRMFPILVKHQFMPYMEEHRSTMNFLLNNSLLLAIFGLECLLLRIIACQGIHWLLPCFSFISSIVFYQASISSAFQLGELCRAAFDLFRYHLANALGLSSVQSFRKEQIMWEQLTDFWNEQPDLDFDKFNYRISGWPIDTFEYKEKGK